MHSFKEGICYRCGVKETKKNTHTFCKVPTLRSAALDRWRGYNYVIAKRWGNRWDEHVVQTVEVAESEKRWIAGWRSHVLIETRQKVACVQCGRYGANKKSSMGVHRNAWLHQPCLGCKQMPKGLAKLIQAGVFDGALAGRCIDGARKVHLYLEAEGLHLG